MGLLMWIDLILFICLFALFIYVFVSVALTNLHKVYLMFHLFVLLWPICQFAINMTEDPQLQLYCVNLAFVGISLMGAGWLVFSIYLADEMDYFKNNKRPCCSCLLSSRLLVSLSIRKAPLFNL